MNIILRVACLLVGYCFGLIQTAYIYGRLNGIDIREHGSGNSGTTNALRVLGKKAGLIVFAGDFLKAAIPCVIARVVAEHYFQNAIYPMILLVGFGVVIGHNFPVYMGFKGGKGIAATAGVILGVLDVRIMIVCALVFLICVAITRYVSLGSLLVVSSFFGVFLILGLTEHIMNPVTEVAYKGNELIESYIIIFLFASLAFWRHKANIVRLIHGEENKVFSKK